MSDSQEEERPLAWIAVLEHTPVFASDGERVGTVSEVVGAEDDDIFHGIEVGEGILGRVVLIPAEHVTDITNRRIQTDLSSEAVRALPAYKPGESYHLGFVGLFRKHLGWVEDRRDAP
jgi:uncharacterized protein YrrD